MYVLNRIEGNRLVIEDRVACAHGPKVGRSNEPQEERERVASVRLKKWKKSQMKSKATGNTLFTINLMGSH